MGNLCIPTSSPVREYLDSNPYRIEDVWEAASNKPIRVVKLTDLSSTFTEKIWANDDGEDTSILEVLNAPEKSKTHIRMINDANLAYPILLAYKTDGSYDVIDGMHRLAKIYQKKGSTVKAQVIDITTIKKRFPPTSQHNAR